MIGLSKPHSTKATDSTIIAPLVIAIGLFLLASRQPFDCTKFALFVMADNTPLSSDPLATHQQSQMQRTRSKELVDDNHHQVIDEDPLLISQTLTYVTDDGSVVHSFQSAPLSFGE